MSHLTIHRLRPNSLWQSERFSKRYRYKKKQNRTISDKISENQKPGDLSTGDLRTHGFPVFLWAFFRQNRRFPTAGCGLSIFSTLSTAAWTHADALLYKPHPLLQLAGEMTTLASLTRWVECFRVCPETFGCMAVHLPA